MKASAPPALPMKRTAARETATAETVAWLLERVIDLAGARHAAWTAIHLFHARAIAAIGGGMTRSEKEHEIALLRGDLAARLRELLDGEGGAS
jgi:hypothetical protein